MAFDSEVQARDMDVDHCDHLMTSYYGQENAVCCITATGSGRDLKRN